MTLASLANAANARDPSLLAYRSASLSPHYHSRRNVKTLQFKPGSPQSDQEDPKSPRENGDAHSTICTICTGIKVHLVSA